FLMPLLVGFTREYPDIKVELTTDDSLVDIVQQGFDAGVRLSGIVEKDMISVAIGPPVKLCVAATPEYFARYGKPRHPHDLLNHQCVVFRYPSGKPFHWQFAKELEIAVAGNIILDDVDAELEAVLMGAGIGYLLYEQIKEYLDTGRLECVLEDWSTERSGFQIYYPNRQYMSCGLRAFLDYVKTGQICQSQRHRPQ
ncbi:LysR substrate-binding domain-containing protein, partial [Escherichia coli]